MQTQSATHFESAFDALWQAHTNFTKYQMEMLAASMTVGIEFWDQFQISRGQRAIQGVEQSHFGKHEVIQVAFR